MAYEDRMNFHAWKLIEAAAIDDQSAGAEAFQALHDSDVDAAHVAQALAFLVAPFLKKNPDWEQMIADRVEAARLTVAMDMPDDPNMFESPH